MRIATPVLLSIFFVIAILVHQLEAKVIDEHIYLVPAGDIDIKTLDVIKRRLPDILPMRVRIEVETRQELPQTAYDAARQQYNAAILLEDILKKITIGTATERVIVVVDVDLFIPGVDFVYGLAR